MRLDAINIFFFLSFFKFKLNQQTADSNLYNTHLKCLIIHNSSLKSLLLENKLSDYLTSSGRLEELFPILLRKKNSFHNWKCQHQFQVTLSMCLLSEYYPPPAPLQPPCWGSECDRLISSSILTLNGTFPEHLGFWVTVGFCYRRFSDLAWYNHHIH